MTDSRHPWFARKTIGWGWVPASWQGWLLTAAYVALVYLLARVFPPSAHRVDFFVCLILATLLLLAVAVLKSGPRQGD